MIKRSTLAGHKNGPNIGVHFIVWQRLVGIVSDQLDVPISDVTRQARFVEDLLCD